MAENLIENEITEIKDFSRKYEGNLPTNLNELSRAAVFGAVYVAVQECLGITPFDEQLMAAIHLDEGSIIEMQTGEGKTLSAVFSAVYNAAQGRKVHILTFNDYLAKRDFEWMGDIYRKLNISVSMVLSHMDKAERKAAYQADVVYLTAKEAGFDYLRDFVADNSDSIVQVGLDYAIVDEADSIMIDEARIPLVIASQEEVETDENLSEIFTLVQALDEKCYAIDMENRTVFLTDKGISVLEGQLGYDNLYDDENYDVLTKINDCLAANFMLKVDEDYVVRNGEIVLIDEFTGRAANNRHYPGFLHSALEVKHGLRVTSRGKIMGTIALQFFLRRYQKLAGMTGTAASAEDEFYQLYDLKLQVIPTHKPSLRVDREIEIFTHGKAKWKAVISAIKQANDKGQPVLVGTESIAQSQVLAESLEKIGVSAVVLNAKNDDEEAQIISEAGAFGRVTVSTSMAGRGVDIKLGGADERDKERVIEAGGLLIIGTFLAESARINAQLNGRAGRQGDIGESRLFVALDDEIFEKYNLKGLVPNKHYPKNNSNELQDNPTLRKEIMRIQRIAQGDALDERADLLRYTMIGEKHRDITFSSRKDYLTGEQNAQLWQKNVPDLYQDAVEKFGEEKLQALQNRLICSILNDYWSDYIEYTDYLKKGIHLMQVGGKSPSEEYNIACEEYYQALTENIVTEVCETLETILTLDSIDEYEVEFPQAVWTYLVEDKNAELLKKPFIVNLLEDKIIDDEIDEDGEIEIESTIFAGEMIKQESEITDKNTEEIEKIEKKGFFGSLFGKKKKD